MQHESRMFRAQRNFYLTGQLLLDLRPRFTPCARYFRPCIRYLPTPSFYLTLTLGFCLVLLVVIGRVYTLLKQAPNPNPNPNPHPHPNADPLHAAQAGEQAGGHHRGAQKAGRGRVRRVQGHVR